MKRRSFVRKSVAAAIIAATPMALTGLVNAEGGGEGTETGTASTYFTATTEDSTIYTTLGCAGYIAGAPDSDKSFKYSKTGSDGKTHMYCYKEYQCDNGFEVVYCTKSISNGNGGEQTESDCGVAVLGKTGNSKCDDLDKKDPGEAWP